jgi:hypothetical protein
LQISEFPPKQFRFGIGFRRLAVSVFTVSWLKDNSRRNSSFCANNAPAVTLSFLESDKELFPSAASPRASVMQPTKIIAADFRFKISDLKTWRLPRAHFNLQSAIFNLQFPLLRHFRRVRTVFLKQTRGRKFAELVTNHVFGHENRLKNLSVVNQKRVADKIRRHHRAPRPGLNWFFRARVVHLIDLLQKMRFDDGSFLQ